VKPFGHASFVPQQPHKWPSHFTRGQTTAVYYPEALVVCSHPEHTYRELALFLGAPNDNRITGWCISTRVMGRKDGQGRGRFLRFFKGVRSACLSAGIRRLDVNRQADRQTAFRTL